MKQSILIVLAVVLSVNTYAQDSLTQRQWTSVVKVDSVSKADLYNRARTWFAKTYGSAKSVIQMDDKEAGEIVGKGLVETWMSLGLGVKAHMFVYYTLTVYVKDGKYKYEAQINNEMECPDPKNGWSKDYNWYVERPTKTSSTSLMTQTTAGVKNVITSLETGMQLKNNPADF